MSLLIRSRNILGQSIFVVALLLMSISLFAAEEHKSESKPAEHGSRPSQSHGSPNHASQGRASQGREAGPSHAAGSNRPSGSSHTSAPRNENKPSQGRTTGNRAGGTAGRPGNAGNRGGTAGGNRGGMGNRGAMGNRGGNAAGNRGMGAHAPGRTVSLRGGGSASIRPNGSIRSINRNGMQIHNNLRGGRTVVSEHNGVRIVNTGHGGYVQHAYMTRGGRSYYSRTFYDHGVYRTGVYRGYLWGGHHYYGYYPGFWFHPGFYGWGWHPWGAPVYWGVGIGGWGWAGSPWWGVYSGWWTPYPAYAGPAFWLTDYLISSQLQAAYASQYNTAAGGGYDQGSANYGDNGGQAANSGQVTLSPEVKEAIAEEVKAQLQEQEQQAPSQGLGSDSGAAAAPANDNQAPPALDPARRTFVVDNAITVVSDGQECNLTGGDVITRLTDTPDSNQQVTASVAASKKGECGEGKPVLVSVDDLQEMHNHFEEQLNNGLKVLAAKQGTNGMPKAPDAGTVSSDLQTPPPDQNASKDLADQQAQADQAEAQAKQDAAAGGGQ
ncbi:MAG: hypothetical protein WA172_00660 [Terriglobales bacterium]